MTQRFRFSFWMLLALVMAGGVVAYVKDRRCWRVRCQAARD